MTTTRALADFAASVSRDDLPDDVVAALKKRVLDSLGIAIGALDADATDAVHATVSESGDGPATCWFRGTAAPAHQAAMHNTALTRYLDFMDSFLAPGETPHPSDTIASVVAAAEERDASGAELLAAIGVAYEVQAALAWDVPVRDRGFDHVTHTVIAAAAGTGAVMDMDPDRLAHALGIAGTAHNALRVTRTAGINMWKGLASANAARNAVYSCMLARNGVDGPVDLFEGQKGWNQVIAGTEFDPDLDPSCTAVETTMTKRYVAETYAQSAVEGIIDLAEQHDLDPSRIESIHLDTFHGAKLIIGGGEGDRHAVETREQADHSLPYMLAAACIDRELTGAQYHEDRITRDDVQRLLRTVTVAEDDDLTARFEDGEMPANLTVTMEDGTEHTVEKDAFQGHPTQPASWDMIEAKFHRLASDHYPEQRRDAIVSTVHDLDTVQVRDLTALLD